MVGFRFVPSWRQWTREGGHVRNAARRRGRRTSTVPALSASKKAAVVPEEITAYRVFIAPTIVGLSLVKRRLEKYAEAEGLTRHEGK